MLGSNLDKYIYFFRRILDVKNESPVHVAGIRLQWNTHVADLSIIHICEQQKTTRKKLKQSLYSDR
jgi:hypothetical protein